MVASSPSSTFSRSAAEVLTAITGSAFFPGGLGSYTVTNLAFESGPSQPVQLQWATYYDASDQAGISRIWGGIHPPVDDFTGRRAGSQSGQAVWALAKQYFDGSITNTPTYLAMRPVGGNQLELSFNTIRGLYYKLQSTTDLSVPFTDGLETPIQAGNTSMLRTNAATGTSTFYRTVRTLGP